MFDACGSAHWVIQERQRVAVVDRETRISSTGQVSSHSTQPRCSVKTSFCRPVTRARTVVAAAAVAAADTVLGNKLIKINYY